MRRSKHIPFNAFVKQDKLVIELSFQNILAGVESANRMTRRINRENPAEEMPLYTVTDARAFAARVLRSLKWGHRGELGKLSDVFDDAIGACLDGAARRKSGIREIPQPMKQPPRRNHPPGGYRKLKCFQVAPDGKAEVKSGNHLCL